MSADDGSATESGEASLPNADAIAIDILKNKFHGGHIVAMEFARAIGAFATAYGIPFALLFAVVMLVWLFGSDQTQDDFIRAVIFGEDHRVTFFAVWVLVGAGIVMIFLRRKAALEETAEMKRMAAQRNRLQEDGIGKKLASSSGPEKVERRDG